MSKECSIYHLLFFFLFTGNILLFSACNDDDEPAEWIRPVELNDIDAYIKTGILLETFQEKDGLYTFTFENKTAIELPSKNIIKIQTFPERWMTVLTLANNQEYSIPTQGSSIESFIKDIKVNPSGYCPLAASIHVNVPAKGRFGVNVLSKEGAKTPDQSHLHPFVDGYEQEVIVLGLYENHENQIELTYTDQDGKERGKTTLVIPTEPLQIKQLPEHKVVTRQFDRMEPGMTLVSCPGEGETDTSLPYMVDADGEVRWVLDWNKHPQLNHWGGHCGLARMKNGNYVAGDTNNGQAFIVNALGEIQQSWSLKDLGLSFHHEVRETANGQILMAVSKNDAKIADQSNIRVLDHIVEINPESGNLATTWDLVEILDSSRTTYTYRPEEIGGESGLVLQSPMNWCHNNGVFEMRDGSILCTSRWQGLVKFTRSGQLKWVISPHNGWQEEFRKYLLTPLDRDGKPITDPDVLNGKKPHPDFEWSWGVHCPVETPNGNVMLFDNGYIRHYDFTNKDRYSRAVEYEVDEQAMTVRQVWSYGRERGNSCYSTHVSGVQYLEQTGNRLFCPGFGIQLGKGYGGRVIEIDPKTEEVVFEMEVLSSGSPAFHRANRISLYPDN